MEKRISYDQFMAVKRVAQAVNPLISKRNKADKALKKAQEEYNSYNEQIEALQAGIKQIVGFGVEELVKKVIEPATNDKGEVKTDKQGNPMKVTKYVPTDIVSYDKDNRQYVITTPDAEEKSEEEAPANLDEMSNKDNGETDIHHVED